MKSFVAVAVGLLLSSSAVFAMPSVGDRALFDLTVINSGNTYNGTFEVSLTSYDAANDQFSEHSVITINGSVQANDQVVKRSALVSDAFIAQLPTQCTADGGTLETVTVPAGTFNTCNLPINNNGTTGHAWLGNATFGFIQQAQTQPNGQQINLALRSTVAGSGFTK